MHIFELRKSTYVKDLTVMYDYIFPGNVTARNVTTQTKEHGK